MSSRFIVGVTVLLLAVTALRAPAASPEGKQPAKPAEAKLDPEALLKELGRLKEQPALVVFVNLQQLTGSDLGKQALEVLKPVLGELAAVGLDPQHDLASLLFAGSATSGEDAVLFVRGRFNIQKIVQRLKKEDAGKLGVKLGIEKGILYCRIEREKLPTIYAAPVDQNTIAFTTEQDTLITLVGKKPGEPPAATRERLKRLDTKQSLALDLLVTKELREWFEQRRNMFDPLQALAVAQRVSVNIRVTRQAEFAVEILAKDNFEAKQIKDFIEGMVFLGAMGNEALKPILEDYTGSRKYEAKRSTLKWSWRLEEKTLRDCLGLPGPP